jgi:hypothetical protein
MLSNVLPVELYSLTQLTYINEKNFKTTTPPFLDKKKPLFAKGLFINEMAHWTGVEPVTYRLEIGCSIQLSYRCA